MTTFTPEEVEAEFQKFVARGAANDWSAWADQFTEDAEYVEHAMGHVTDGNRVVMYCWNVFDPLPGMTGEYKFAVVTILHYAGNGQWSYEEDVYNEKEAEAVLARFLEDAAAAGATGVPTGPER